MELFRFIKWQWNRFNYDEIVLGFDAIVTGCTLVYFWSTAGFMMALMTSVGVFFGIVIIAMIEQQIRKQWRMYKAQQAKEAQHIVDKLRGSSR